MKRSMTRLLISALLTLGAFTIPTTAQATGRGPCSEDRYEVDRQMPRSERVRKVKSLIRCVFSYLDITGEIPTAFVVVERESGFTPWARNPDTDGACRPWSTNPYGSCGASQHLAVYWPGRVRAFLHRRWFPGTWPHVPILQLRANVMTMALMVRRGGWSPWAL